MCQVCEDEQKHSHTYRLKMADGDAFYQLLQILGSRFCLAVLHVSIICHIKGIKLKIRRRLEKLCAVCVFMAAEGAVTQAQRRLNTVKDLNLLRRGFSSF